MSSGEVLLLACIAAICILAACAAAVLRRARVATPDTTPDTTLPADTLRDALEAHKIACDGQMATLSKNLDSLADSMTNPGEVSWEGRLNLSVRAQALQLLRAGMSPDTAAATLGVPSRDIRLLEKVSRILVAR